MTNTIILDNFLPGNLAEQCLNAITDHHTTNPNDWSRYDNPWEHKTILNKKLPPTPIDDTIYGFGECPPAYPYSIQEALIATCLQRMRQHCHPLCRALGFGPSFHQWIPDDTYHYDGVFIYQPGDYLKMHLDAGLHPTNGLRKHATATLYLTHSPSSPLRMWSAPHAVAEDIYIDVIPNRLVCFTNDDNAWHGAPDPVGKYMHSGEQRVVLTVSFMSNPQADIPGYTNKRTRAYFCDTGDPTIDAMRDARSQDGHDLYRVTPNQPVELA